MREPLLIMAAIACLPLAAGGCASVSLATSTGPRPAGANWSDADKQFVHVGETVDFDAIHVKGSTMLQPGPDEYCAAMVGATRVEAEADLDGHFGFTYTFDDLAPGDEILVEAAIMRQVDARDYMQAGTGYAASESPYNQPDQQLGSDKVLLEVYQARIDTVLRGGADDLMPATGVLRLYPGAADEVSVYADRPVRRGFVLDGPAPDGSYRLTYRPLAQELRSHGQTPFEFRIEDRAGRVHTASGSIDTP